MVGWGEGHPTSASDKNKENIIIESINKELVRYLKSQVRDENSRRCQL
jgi:hypothetical protein